MMSGFITQQMEHERAGLWMLHACIMLLGPPHSLAKMEASNALSMHISYVLLLSC